MAKTESRLSAKVVEIKRHRQISENDVNGVLDLALTSEKLSAESSKELKKLLELPPDRFDSPQTRQRLETLVTMPSDTIRARAYQLERDDGVIDLNDAKELAALCAQPGNDIEERKASLRTLAAGVNATKPARKAMQAAAASAGGAGSVAGSGQDASGVARVSASERKKMDKAPLRTYVLTASGATQVDPKTIERAPSQAIGSYADVSGQRLQSELGNAAKARARDLRDLGSATAASADVRVGAEDGSLRVRNMHMAMLGEDQAGTAFLDQMAQIGQIEGFNVVARTTAQAQPWLSKHFAKERLTNTKVFAVDGDGDFWSEDQGEIDTAGNVRVPAPVEAVGIVTNRTLRDRAARFFPNEGLEDRDVLLDDAFWKAHAEAKFSAVGAVAGRKAHEVVAAIAVSKGASLRANLSHIEGGNLLVGTLKNGRGYALVGRDSIAWTRNQLSIELGRKVTDDEVRAVIARDLGIARESVFPVEQPLSFHIDMWMLPIKPGEVIVNDARAAAQMYIKWQHEDHEARKPKPPAANASQEKKDEYEQNLRWWQEDSAELALSDERRRTRSERRAKGEERVLADLERAGLKVHRMAAVFESEHFMNMNFANAEQGTNSRGERFLVALGGDPRAEQYVAAQFAKITGGDLKRVYFLDRDVTQSTLSGHGGISCRVKSEGTLP